MTQGCQPVDCPSCGEPQLARNTLFDGKPMSGSLFDFGLYFFHNAKEALSRGTGPYFYLPKLESHLEARLWNDVFVAAQDALGVPQKSIKATVLIETILATFEMDEILWELKDHSAGLNCGAGTAPTSPAAGDPPFTVANNAGDASAQNITVQTTVGTIEDPSAAPGTYSTTVLIKLKSASFSWIWDNANNRYKLV